MTWLRSRWFWGILLWLAVPLYMDISNTIDDKEAAHVLVWILVGTAAIRAIAHYVLSYRLLEQNSTSQIGKYIMLREMFLGVSATAMVIFHALLATAVTMGVLFIPPTGRMYLYYIVGTTAVAASVMSHLLLKEYREERWGKEIDSLHTLTKTSEDVEEVKADVKDIKAQIEADHVEVTHEHS